MYTHIHTHGYTHTILDKPAMQTGTAPSLRAPSDLLNTVLLSEILLVLVLLLLLLLLLIIIMIILIVIVIVILIITIITILLLLLLILLLLLLMIIIIITVAVDGCSIRGKRSRTEIDTSEFIVDFQWPFPMYFSGVSQHMFTFQWYVQKDCHFSSAFSLELSN